MGGRAVGARFEIGGIARAQAVGAAARPARLLHRAGRRAGGAGGTARASARRGVGGRQHHGHGAAAAAGVGAAHAHRRRHVGHDGGRARRRHRGGRGAPRPADAGGGGRLGVRLQRDGGGDHCALQAAGEARVRRHVV
eukprot:350024-Chlamydomonas_euryale.AAC.1